ncbi:flagellar hook-basal body protein [Campylobacter sp. RM16192]|uniref:flagellar hook-basal body protein n=1 Tax=Campylobacter sp. RM16192 TaxID=1660080 RepID=UPI0014529FA2|nr:flagellar hook-basal body protein [Campylobacter sp. RM16192]QCD52783.1 flagellar basal body rod protein [Campylobacter sp. RM16192]
MQNGYYQATGAMVTQFNRLDVISNNLANINTIGFKRDDVVVGDFERIFQEFRDVLPLENHTKQAAKFLNRTIDRVPQISEQYVDFSNSGMKFTGNTLDFAIKREDLFFLVETKTGEVRLTKNGAFSLDNEGFLVTKEGFRVLPSNYFEGGANGIQIPQEERLSVDKNGNIYANDEQIARFYLAQPKEIRNLTKEGDNLYVLPDLKELRDLGDDVDAVSQGYTQISNVNAVTEMLGLIETNRMVDMYQKVMRSHMDDLNQDAVSKLANIKA